MRTPICKQCAWGKTLCSQCSKKLADGKISSLDVEVSRILYKINETHNITDAQFSKALDFGNTVIILTEGQPGMLIGKGGQVVSTISSALQKKARVIKQDDDFKRIIADMIAPARLSGVNSSWSQGKEKLSVKIPAQDKKRLYMDVLTLQKAIMHWIQKDVEIAFD